MPKLTKEFIESEVQSPLAGQRFYRDDNLSGFAVRVTAKSKSFILEKRVGGINRRITIGRCDEIDLDTAKTNSRVHQTKLSLCGKQTFRRLARYADYFDHQRHG